MGTAYTICCKHCGAHIHTRPEVGFGGFLPHRLPSGSSGTGYVETQTAIRCPACCHRLNATREAFDEQVEVTYSWD